MQNRWENINVKIGQTSETKCADATTTTNRQQNWSNQNI